MPVAAPLLRSVEVKQERCVFFFQAEDGIRDDLVTGVQRVLFRSGGDAKILAVPVDKLSSLYRSIEAPQDLPDIQLAQIAHFFAHYKDLEPGKWVRLAGWVGAHEAREELVASVRRYDGADPKPSFRRQFPTRGT